MSNNQSPKVIALFNNKGGVSKTTTCFNLGWSLANKGKKVVMVDTDPQCNLTGMTLEVNEGDLLPEDYRSYAEANIYESLRPAIKSTGERIQAPTCKEVAGRSDLLLMAGSVRLSEVETQLATAMNMGSMLPAMQNVPGSFAEMYKLIGKKYKCDYILLDMSPSLGSLNQVNFLNSDYFVVPMVPDVFSVMALRSLSEIIPDWIRWSNRVQQMNLFSDPDLVYKFTPTIPKFLGTVIQRYNLRKGMPSKSFQQYIEQLESVAKEEFVPALAKSGLLVEDHNYSTVNGMDRKYTIAQIPDFNSLIARAQDRRKPVFELTVDELSTWGAAQGTQVHKIEEFKDIFSNFANRIINLAK